MDVNEKLLSDILEMVSDFENICNMTREECDVVYPPNSDKNVESLKTRLIPLIHDKYFVMERTDYKDKFVNTKNDYQVLFDFFIDKKETLIAILNGDKEPSKDVLWDCEILTDCLCSQALGYDVNDIQGKLNELEDLESIDDDDVFENKCYDEFSDSSEGIKSRLDKLDELLENGIENEVFEKLIKDYYEHRWYEAKADYMLNTDMAMVRIINTDAKAYDCSQRYFIVENLKKEPVIITEEEFKHIYGRV